MNDFHYANTETKIHGGKKTIRRVVIREGKGYKSVSEKNRRVKRQLTEDEIHKIKSRIFIPKLFVDCRVSGARTRKCRHLEGGSGKTHKNATMKIER